MKMTSKEPTPIPEGMTRENRPKPSVMPEWLKNINSIPACKECGLIAGKCLLESYGEECKRDKNND